jgi:nucleoside-specific outer membrane channel protein Tsx
VAISGTTAIVGAHGHAKNAGRAYVFTKTPTGWKQSAELKGPDTVADDEFGASLAISGTTAIVGAFGHAASAGRAYVFTKTPAAWKQVAELKDSDTVAGDYFGASVAISGTTAVVGAFVHANDAGRAYVFEA